MPEFKTPFELALAGLIERITKDASLSAGIKEAALRDIASEAPDAFEHLKATLKNELKNDNSKHTKSS